MAEELPQPAVSSLVLKRQEGRLELHTKGSRGAVCVDLHSAASRARRRGLRRRDHPLARAVGARGPFPSVMDATAGLGRDTLVLAALGYPVLATERDPCLHALLADGLHRAAADPKLASLVAGIELHCGSAQEVLSLDRHPDCIYLDPMFPSRPGSALVKKEMQVFQELLGHEDPAETQGLFTWARTRAVLRVVVKRPSFAPPLAADPDYQVTAKTVRWDVYLRD